MKTETEDLVRFLRDLSEGSVPRCDFRDYFGEAADRIEELEAELAANIQVLERIARFLKAEKEKGDAK